jgi:hypothetical protein
MRSCHQCTVVSIPFHHTSINQCSASYCIVSLLLTVCG